LTNIKTYRIDEFCCVKVSTVYLMSQQLAYAVYDESTDTHGCLLILVMQCPVLYCCKHLYLLIYIILSIILIYIITYIITYNNTYYPLYYPLSFISIYYHIYNNLLIYIIWLYGSYNCHITRSHFDHCKQSNTASVQ